MNILFLFLWILVLKGNSALTSAVNGNFHLIGGRASTGGNTMEFTSITCKCPCDGHQTEITENYKSNEDSLGRNELSLNVPQGVVRDYKVNTKKRIKNKYMRCEKDLNKTQDVLRYYKNQLDQNAAQLVELNATLKSCKLNLNSTQEVVYQKQQEVLRLKEQIQKHERNTNSVIIHSNSNSNHYNKIPDFKMFPVLCIDGWTIIQQRINGNENFNRNWEDYKNGFGVFTGDFFLGLEKIHRLMNDQPHELIIHLEKFDGTNYHARYKNFKIAGEDDKYKLLSLGSFSGNSTWNGMKYLVGQQFSTIDSDNDAWMEGSCAKERQAGWWFRKCALSNPNGVYHQEETYDESSDWWNMYYSLKSIHMAIRQKQ